MTNETRELFEKVAAAIAERHGTEELARRIGDELHYSYTLGRIHGIREGRKRGMQEAADLLIKATHEDTEKEKP